MMNADCVIYQVAVSRALNGIGLAIVGPAIQSLVADSTDDGNRGVAFGWLQLTGNAGAVVGGLCSILIAPVDVFGIPGWRVSFHLIGLLSVIVGVLVRLFAKDPHYSDDGAKGLGLSVKRSFGAEVKDLAREARSVIGIPSFQIIVAQGVTGSFPWSALSFATMWLELIGFSHSRTAFLLGCFVVASSLGGLFGGKMGDILSQRFPNWGRIVLSQISSGSAIPLAAVLLLGLPDDPSATMLYALVLLIIGFSISWNASATNNPIFAEIVPEKSRTSIYALDRTFESVLSSFAPWVVASLAEDVYGYRPPPAGSTQSVEIATDRQNAKSLSKALFVAVSIPMALCCLIYSFLYCTYPRDKERAQMQALIESEMQQLEFENSEASPEVRGTGWSGVEDRMVIDLDYEEDNGTEFDEQDERTLLR
uniref:Major facilitator superfamily (MFS) profile domain-containing protein n=1 Tax=Kalanchoe fedtschenkoi TaxID=63787 RepID=A0A7N0UPV2_KALFE